MTEDVCYTGGALGADFRWAMRAKENGHQVDVYSFEGHDCHGNSNFRIILQPEQLTAALPSVKRAAVKLNRTEALHSNNYILKLLCRNFYQVRLAERVYAVGKFNRHGQVDGGTAWAIQMFMNKWSDDNPGLLESVGAGPVFFFDQVSKMWYMPYRDGWHSIQTRSVPKPHGKYAGIGTRETSAKGLAAIDEVYTHLDS